MKKRDNYLAPAIDIVELNLEGVILQPSIKLEGAENGISSSDWDLIKKNN